MIEVDYFQGQVDMGFTTKYFNLLSELHGLGASFLQSKGLKSVFEFGSGLGFFVLAAQNKEMDVQGYGIDSREREFAISKGVEPSRYQLGERHKLKLTREYDAAYCVEVAEHIKDEELIPIFTELAQHCKYLYFTSTPYLTTPEEDAAWGHINVKKQHEWKAFLRGCGWDLLQPEHSVTPWGLFFQSKIF